MGLAGRKQKQRIPADPRNLSWADDASRFGLAYLSKFGWDASQGLGSSGDGMRTHLKVQQKLDMMGIGAQHQRDPNGIAWKQNKDFEALLKRLNENAEQDGEAAMDKAFVCAQEEEVLENGSPVTTKKRKHKTSGDSDTPRKKRKEKSDPAPSLDPASDPPPVPSSLEPLPKSRPMAHRARIRAAKRIAGKPASAISEILGVAPSSSASTSTSTSAPTTPTSSTPPPSSHSHDNLTTSTKSVADYFKEKLLARSSSSSSPASSGLSGSATPSLATTSLGLGYSNVSLLDNEGEASRMGIGSRALVVPLLSQPPESAAAGDGDGDAGGPETSTEKSRRKEERRAEKRKLREAEINQVLHSENGQMGGDGETPRMASEKKRHKQKQKTNSQSKSPRKKARG